MKNKWIKQLKESHQRLLKAFTFTPDKGKIAGDWTKKEIMAHIAGWYEEFDREVGGVAMILKGQRPVSFRYSVDEYNRKSVAKRKNMSKSEILDEIKKSHKQFIEMIEELDAKQITDCFGTNLRGKPINVLWIINESIHHDNNHAGELEKKFK